MLKSSGVALAAMLLGGLSIAAPAAAQAGRIASISPAKARPGDIVTIYGSGFGARNVTVTVGAVPAQVVSGSGAQATFVVPAGVKPGLTQVVATNPGSQAGRIGLRILEGALLQGNANASALEAIFSMPPVRALPEDIEDHVILTRLDLRISPGATVGGLNSALKGIDGGIVSMLAGSPILTVAVPRAASVLALDELAKTLQSFAGIEWTDIAREAATQVLPRAVSNFLDQQLLPTRFPAAWNAMRLATADCTSRRVPVLVADNFIRPAPDSFVGFPSQVPNFFPSPPDESGDESHGYKVTTVLAALFDDQTLTGANPFSQCLDVTGIEIEGLDLFQSIDRIKRNFPASGPFVLNYSNGFFSECEPYVTTSGVNSCTRASILKNPSAVTRARTGAYWKQQTISRWNGFLVAASAGNNRDEIGPKVYPGFKQAAFNSVLTVAADTDPLFSFMQDRSLWGPQVNDPALPDLTATPADVAQLTADLVQAGLDRTAGATNELIVGSTTTGTTFSDLRQSVFSNSGPDVTAVGERIQTSVPTPEQGTSFAAPQVAGLGSYLWLLSDDLRNQPAVALLTRRAIVENARLLAAGKVIDAYATVLSLDAASTPTPPTAPIRFAVLDVNDDRQFDESDVQIYLSHYLDADGKAIADPPARDYSRWDLNGDGFTGGSRTESFDLDRLGSTQYGAAVYSAFVTQQIEDQTVEFDETRLTDMQILCYYAYSPMYTGRPEARSQLLAGCTGVTVKVSPSSTIVAAGAQQQFSAAVTGAQDSRVTWTATGGTISNTGLFTAGTTPGTYRVRATSLAAPTVSGDAAVTVPGGNNVALVSRTCVAEALGVSFSGFSKTVLDPGLKQCAPLPPPPYIAPAVAINNSVSPYRYIANYLENLSANQITSDSISDGAFDAVAEVDVPAIDISQIPTDPNGVRALVQAGASFKIQDSGPYLLTITGTLTSTNCCSTTTSLIISFDGIAAPQVTIKPFTPGPCNFDFQAGTCSFTVTQLMNTLDANGNGLPTQVVFSLAADSGFTTAGVIQNGQKDQARKGEVQLTFKFQKQ